MNLRITDRERLVIEAIGKSGFFKTLTDEEWKKHRSDRAQLIKASEIRQGELRAAFEAAPKAYEIARKNVALARAAFDEAIRAEGLAFQNVRGSSLGLEGEIYSLKKALGEGAHPDIAELISCVEHHLNVLPDALHIGITTERDKFGRSRPMFYSNTPELGHALERLRFIKSRLCWLQEIAYGDDLFDEVQRHYDNVLAISKSFDLRDTGHREWVFSGLKPKSAHAAAAA